MFPESKNMGEAASSTEPTIITLHPCTIRPYQATTFKVDQAASSSWKDRGSTQQGPSTYSLLCTLYTTLYKLYTLDLKLTHEDLTRLSIKFIEHTILVYTQQGPTYVVEFIRHIVS